MKRLQADNLPASVLAACMLGLVICPFIYIAIGALFVFSLAFSLLLLPPLFIGSGFLLWRYLSRPTERPTKILLLILEGISWIAIVAFIILISRFNLMTGFERLGLFCTFFLLASACCLPVVVMRKIALEQRLVRLQKGVSIGVLLVILGLSGLAMIAYQFSTPTFI